MSLICNGTQCPTCSCGSSFYSTSFCSVNLGEQKHGISQHIFWRNFCQRVFHPRNTTCCEQITGPWYGFQDVTRVRQTVPKGFESGCDRQFLYRDPGFHCCHHACISAYLSKARSNKKNMLNGIELTGGALKPFPSQWVWGHGHFSTLLPPSTKPSGMGGHPGHEASTLHILMAGNSTQAAAQKKEPLEVSL